MAKRWTLTANDVEHVVVLTSPTGLRRLVLSVSNMGVPWCDVLLGNPPELHRALVPFEGYVKDLTPYSSFSIFSIRLCNKVSNVHLVRRSVSPTPLARPQRHDEAFHFWYEQSILVAWHATGVKLRAHPDDTVLWYHPDGRSWTISALGSL